MASPDAASGPQRWVLGTKWHRLAPGPSTSEALCGEPLPTDAWCASSAEVVEHGEQTRTSVCGTCERIAAPPSKTLSEADRLARLTPEQLEIYNRRAAEKRRRLKLRKAEKKWKSAQPSKSRSVRTVSGGAPGLGKRR